MLRIENQAKVMLNLLTQSSHAHYQMEKLSLLTRVSKGQMAQECRRPKKWPRVQIPQFPLFTPEEKNGLRIKKSKQVSIMLAVVHETYQHSDGLTFLTVFIQLLPLPIDHGNRAGELT